MATTSMKTDRHVLPFARPAPPPALVVRIEVETAGQTVVWVLPLRPVRPGEVPIPPGLTFGEAYQDLDR
jgi:hypothetical protein